MEDFKQTFSGFHRDFKQILSDSYQVFMQSIQDIVENITSKMCHLVGDVADETEEFNSDRNVSSKSEIGTSVEMLDEDWKDELKKLKGEIELQATCEIDFQMECHGKEGVIMYGRSLEEKLEFLRGAVGLFDFLKKKAVCALWGYINALVYFVVR